MHVTLVYPNISDIRSHDAMQPLAIAELAALTPLDVELSFFDERLQSDVPYDAPTDLVAMTVQTFTARRAYQIAAEYRRRGVPVVMGGFHPTLVPDEAQAFADAIVIGDAEDLWEDVVEDARRGDMKPRYRHTQPSSLSKIASDRTVFADKQYARLIPVQFGRGCRFACEYCAIHAFYGSHVRHRPVHEVAAEIEALDRKTIWIVDDNLYADAEQMEALVRALIPLNVHWCCQTSIDVAWNEPLLRLMQRSGCIAALVGFESLDAGNLVQMRKSWNVKHGSYEDAIHRLYDHGIMIYGGFILGYDHDTVATFDGVLEFALRHKMMVANFAPLCPMPGTELHDQLRLEGRLVRDPWWLHPDHRYLHATFEPRGMSADELTEGCFRMHREFYSNSSVLRRALDRRTSLCSPTHLAAYTAINLIGRREISNRHGHRLGADEPVPLERPASGP